ncbi:alpha/beta hydrolase [Sphingobium sp. MK2]|uniref:alpha/beta fold hydrolase n=1 Tax=Sphingobium sp. MK2 TaxID=3116540 RepID=UPI0032E36100
MGTSPLLSDDPELVPPPPPFVGRLGLLDGPAKGIWCADSGGNGPAVILLHAHTGAAESWAYQQHALADAGFRAIAYSRRGAGLSPAPEGARGDMEDLIAVLDALGVARAHIVGIAAGGFIGSRAVVAMAARVASFTLCCSMGGMTAPDIQARIAATQPHEFHELPVELRELSPSYRFANPEGVARWMDVYRTSLSVRLSSLPPETRTAMRKLATQGGPPIETVAASGVPMHLIYGDADLYAPSALARMLARRLGNARVTTIAEAGHSANWEMPRTFNAAMLSFLAAQ